MSKFFTTTDETSREKKLIADIPDEKKRKSVMREIEEKETHEVMQAGQEDKKKGIAAVASQEKEKQAQDKKREDEIKNRLEMKKKSWQGYKETLAKGLCDILTMLDWIRGWRADVVVTDNGTINIKGKPFATKDGILLVIFTPDGSVLHQGMRVVGEPAIDYAGIYTLALQTENTMDKKRGLLLDKPAPVDSKGNGDAILDQYGRVITGKSPGESLPTTAGVPVS